MTAAAGTFGVAIHEEFKMGFKIGTQMHHQRVKCRNFIILALFGSIETVVHPAKQKDCFYKAKASCGLLISLRI